ncbi:DUF998 domain-containing protein [[Pseudomonas] boreopolis]
MLPARIIGQSIVSGRGVREDDGGMMETRTRDGEGQAAWIAAAGRLAAIVGSAFLAWVVALQFMRDDLAWVDAQLSLYLHGPYGLGLRTAYCLMAAAMAVVALALQQALQAGARSRTVLGLFWCAALGLGGVAIGDSWLPDLAPDVAPLVHLLSAQTAFLCVIAAVLLQSWWFRHDPRWRDRFGPAFAVGVLAFAVLAWNAGVRSAPRGLSQKLAIVLIVGWLVMVGAWLGWRNRAGAAPQATSRDNADVQPEEH